MYAVGYQNEVLIDGPTVPAKTNKRNVAFAREDAPLKEAAVPVRIRLHQTSPTASDGANEEALATLVVVAESRGKLEETGRRDEWLAK